MMLSDGKITCTTARWAAYAVKQLHDCSVRDPAALFKGPGGSLFHA
jgi:hypothetical protein